MGRLDGKVAIISGAARGQGRSHAVRLAQEGADIVALDLCEDVSTSPYPMASREDLEETARLVEAADRRIHTAVADVRDQAALDRVTADALELFGHIDIVSANAGVASFGTLWEVSEDAWRDTLDIVLTGSWKLAKSVIPSMIEAERGGSIIFTSSIGGLKSMANCGHYVAAKHGVIGVMKTLAVEVGQYSIRSNAVCPGTVRTAMATSDSTVNLFCPDVEEPTVADMEAPLRMLTALPVAWMEPEDISDAVVWLASDESRFVTGTALSVDGGWLAQ